MSDICIRDYLNNYDSGKYDSSDVSVQCDAGWYDWFCNDTSLQRKTVALTRKLRQLVLSDKIDIYKNYVFFKNNCPMADAGLYDDFRICDMKTGDVQYTITPKYTVTGTAQVWGVDNDFDKPLVDASWNDVKAFFGVK